MTDKERKVMKEYPDWTYWDWPDWIVSVSKGSRIQNFWNYVEKTTGKRSLKRFVKERTMLTLISGLPTIFGSLLRAIAYRSILGRVGSNCLIERGVRFNIPGKVFLGDRVIVGHNTLFDVMVAESEIRLDNDVLISRYCTLRSGPGSLYIHEGASLSPFCELSGVGGLTIGKNTQLASHAVILGDLHIYKDPSVPIKFQGARIKRVKIGEDVWVGANVVVMPGVTIGDGSVIGAGAVVTKDIPPYSVAVGVPAKVTKKRL